MQVQEGWRALSSSYAWWRC